jgi:ribosomal protein S20
MQEAFMSASISSAGSSSGVFQTNPFRQRANDFQALAKALKSGDLEAAKEAFASLQANAPKGPPPGDGPGRGKIKSDFAALAEALESGNIEDAKAAFETLQKDLKAARAAHGHHHRPKPDDASASNATAALSLTMSSFSITV